MSYLRSLKPDAGLLQIFQAFPEVARPLLEYHEILLRGESPFSAAERELIAAYVSGLNNCNYCRAVHSQTAVALGIHSEALAEIFSGAEPEHVEARMRPVLAFVRKLTLSPGEVTEADVDALLAAGWDDRAIRDATAICGLFNLMNRLVNGLGVEASKEYIQMAAQRLAQGGYRRLVDFLPT
ncbi:MAG TPA: peroxidase-related enzyme [Candidatus Udaeobacter sp.]